MIKTVKKLFTAIILTAVFSLILTLKIATPIYAEASYEEDREFKGIWLSSLIGELPYQDETQYKETMNEAFDVMEHFGYNALIFHVRTHNNAFYPSELNPLASWFKDVDFDVFDPLEWTIQESHNRGIEFHAWLNPYRVNSNFIVGEYPKNNPASSMANLISNSHGEFILNPALPHVRQHVFDSITEIIENYDVDAIHFDDYFYIRESQQYAPLTADGKREQIDLLIEGISDLLKAFNKKNNKAIQFGISPSGVYLSGSGQVTYEEDGTPISDGSATTTTFIHYGDYLYADTIKWSVEGWIDYIVPQLYWARNHPSASYRALSDWWNKMYKYLDTNLYFGLGVYQADEAGNTYGWKNDINELYQQISITESSTHVGGYVLFSYKHLQNGYHNDITKYSAKQVNNAYSNRNRLNYKLPPIVRNMHPILLPDIKNVDLIDGTLSWDSLDGGKFYYVYKSAAGKDLTYSNDEIVGIMAHKEGTMSFEIEDYDNKYQYDVKAISRTNHFSGTAPEPDDDDDIIVNPLVTMKTNVTVREATKKLPQGLKFNANLDNKVKNNEHGFYVIYGESSTEELETLLSGNETLEINGKKVFKVTVKGLTKTLDYSVVVTGIPENNLDTLVTVIAYIVDSDGNIVLSENAITSSISQLLN